MAKAGEKITDPVVLERLAKAREKANQIRKQKAEERQTIKLAKEVQRKNELAQADSIITGKGKQDSEVIPESSTHSDQAEEEVGSSSSEQPVHTKVVQKKTKKATKQIPKPKPKTILVEEAYESEDSLSEEEEVEEPQYKLVRRSTRIRSRPDTAPEPKTPRMRRVNQVAEQKITMSQDDMKLHKWKQSIFPTL